MPELSSRCPYCYSRMRVTTLHCDRCETEVKSAFSVPAILNLSPDQQKFAIDFILASGSLKEMATQYGVSYPTVRGRLDRVIEALRARKSPQDERRAAILDAVEERKLSPQEASKILSDSDKR